MRLASIVALVLVSFTIRAEEADPDKLLKKLAKLDGDVLLELRTVKDKATAETAQKQLAELGRVRGEAERGIAALKLSKDERAAFQKKAKDDLAPVNEMIRKEIIRVSLVPDAIGVLDETPVVSNVARELESRAKLQATILERALKTYMLKNDGNPPMAIKDIGRYLEKASDLLDPWGREFQLGESDNGGGTTIYFLWTPNPYGGGKKRIDSLREKK